MSGDVQSIKDKLVDHYTKVLYGEELKVYDINSAYDLPVPLNKQKLMDNIHEDVCNRFLGAGIHQAAAFDGLHVLNLGCGHGRDVFLYSQLVGPEGHVIGVDITPNSVQYIESMKDYHMKKFGYNKSNVQGLVADVEDLSVIPDCSIDVVMSNGMTCVVPNKDKLLKEVFRILKVGGEFAHWDGYCSEKPFDEIVNNDGLWAEGYGGAFYWKDFIDQCCSVGFTTPLFVTIAERKGKPDAVKRYLANEDLLNRFYELQYGNASYRAFKVDASGSVPASATYNGRIKDHENEFQLDFNTVFKPGVAVDVGAEVVAILKQSRFAPYFTFSPATEGFKAKDLIVDPFEWMARHCK